MTFAGWTLPELLPLLAIGGAAITGLYLLRMRRREVEVPFAALWEQVSRESESRRLWRRLRRVLSWLLQVAILGLLCLALGDPQPSASLRPTQTLAIVLDRSASMAAVADPQTQTTRLDAAIAVARSELARMGAIDRALVIAAGEEVDVLTPLTADAALAIEAVERTEATYGEADLRRAIALARHALGDREGARILVLSDGALSPTAQSALQTCRGGPLPCELRKVGGPTDNAAITAFAARRPPHQLDRVEVLAEVRNFGDTPTTVELEIEADGVSVGRRRLELGPGQARREILSDLDAARAQLVARIEPVAEAGPGTGIALDDTAYAVIAPLRPLEVTLVTDGTNLFLEAALLAQGEHLRLAAVSIDDARREPQRAELQDADLVIFDPGAQPLPTDIPATHRVFFDPWRHPAGPCPIPKRADVSRPYLTEQLREHPILENVVLKDVNIARGTTLSSAPGDTALVRSLGEPIVVLREGQHIDIAFGFDPRQSDLALRTAFPLLVDNVLRFVEQRTPGFVASAPLGQSQELSLADLGLDPTGVTRVEVVPPSAPATDPAPGTPVERGRIRLRALVPGVYRIVATDGPNAGASVEVAVNQADPYASDLHARVEGDEARPEAPVVETEARAPWFRGPLWTVVAILVAVVLALEWATYHRRITV